MYDLVSWAPHARRHTKVILLVSSQNGSWIPQVDLTWQAPASPSTEHYLFFIKLFFRLVTAINTDLHEDEALVRRLESFDFRKITLLSNYSVDRNLKDLMGCGLVSIYTSSAYSFSD